MLGAFLWDPRFVVVAGARRDPVGGLHAVDVPARVSTATSRNDENATLPDLSSARVGQRRPAVRAGDRHGRVPDVFLKPMEPAVQRIVEQVQARPAGAGVQTNCRRSEVEMANGRRFVATVARPRAVGTSTRRLESRIDR